MARDPRIDAYIERAAPFAQPILAHLRELVHEACPDVEETMKWGMPSFSYRGGILCGMAAFKQHASFGYHRHAEVMGVDAPRDGMGSYGKLASPRDLPAKKVLLAHLRKAMALGEAGKPPAARKAAPKAPLPMPEDLRAALAADPGAKAGYDAFPPGAQREYIEWIVEAKRADTRARRVAQAVAWIAEGKRRHWKYQDC